MPGIGINSMVIIPAIDIKNGKCVRLIQGKADQETIYSDDPVAMAQKWVNLGAERLHVIDLDGAFTGEPKNLETVLAIKKKTGAFVQMGGGIRKLKWVEKILSKGIDRVILGTIIFSDSDLAQKIFSHFKKRIIVALDVDKDRVAIQGWKNSSEWNLSRALREIIDLGCQEIIFTDVSRDGTLKGVNVEAVQEIMKKTSMRVIASGGVSSLDDISQLKSIQSPGCVVGKALYDGRMDLRKAIELVKN